MNEEEKKLIQEALLRKKDELQKEKKIEQKIFFFTILFTLIIGTSVFFINILSALSSQDESIEKYIEKNATLNDLENIITRNGDLEAIRQAYSTQPRVRGYERIINRINTGGENYYHSTIPLSEVLSDLRVKAFREGNSDLVSILNKIAKEYEHVNPFDKLQVGQKYYFENIRIKANENYEDISIDINNIAEELHQKNTLVSEYLRDSEMSFRISIFAVFISLIIGGYQIYTMRPTVMRKILYDSLSDINSKRKENDLSK